VENTSGIDDEVNGQSRSRHSQHIAPHAGPLGLNHDDEDIVMDHSALSISPCPDDAEVYGLSNLRRSRRIADGVEKIGQQQWGSNASVHFGNDEEESDEEEEEEDPDIEDEPINDSDSDIASDEEDDDDMFVGPGQEGISLWDSLGEGFLREVSQLGMLFLYHYYFYYLKKFQPLFERESFWMKLTSLSYMPTPSKSIMVSQGMHILVFDFSSLRLRTIQYLLLY
jgi:hypothetical protein